LERVFGRRLELAALGPWRASCGSDSVSPAVEFGPRPLDSAANDWIVTSPQ
jgi:hypothetical protein